MNKVINYPVSKQRKTREFCHVTFETFKLVLDKSKELSKRTASEILNIIGYNSGISAMYKWEIDKKAPTVAYYAMLGFIAQHTTEKFSLSNGGDKEYQERVKELENKLEKEKALLAFMVETSFSMKELEMILVLMMASSTQSPITEAIKAKIMKTLIQDLTPLKI